MKDKDLLVDRVSKKTNVKKEDIFKLANDLQKKDLNNEKDMRDFIQTVAKVTNQSLDQRKIDKLIKIMQNKLRCQICLGKIVPRVAKKYCGDIRRTR